ncbi:hypothetical protein CBP30_22695, partial [Fischerella thermalis WC157]|uniref:hypothetical protein n=1 Tax=Fischerella thermalis TaxID=372787 RepID=UPI000CB56A6D
HTECIGIFLEAFARYGKAILLFAEVVFEENGFYARQLARNEPQAKAMGKHKDIFCDNTFADLGLDNAGSQFNGTQYELLCNAGLWGNQGEGHSEVFGSDRRGNRLDNAHHI